MECNWFKLWMTTQNKKKTDQSKECLYVQYSVQHSKHNSNNNNKKRQTNKQQAHNQNDSNPLNVSFLFSSLYEQGRVEQSKITCCALNCQFGLVCGCVPNVQYYHQQMIINLWIKWLFHLLLRIYHATNDVVSLCCLLLYWCSLTHTASHTLAHPHSHTMLAH